jgi:hypothetical protein
MHDDINEHKASHSRESGNPEMHWIPGQARNDKLLSTYVVVYNFLIVCKVDSLGEGKV